LKVGNQTATAIALAALVDYNLRDESTQSIVIATGGTELLINLLETDHNECRVMLYGLIEIFKNCFIVHLSFHFWQSN